MSLPYSPAGHPLTVLVVDDTATNRQILQVFLAKLGHRVITAEDGAQAVAAFERDMPDLIIMDVMMPVMDGFEATRRIKALCGEHWVPVLFLSALDKEQNLVAGLDAGGDDYLPKPVNFVVLDAKLRSLTRALTLQHSLEYERRRAAAISDNLVDGIIMIDEKGSICWCNPAAEQIFGYAQSEMVGHNINMLMPEPYHSEHDGYLSSYIHGGQPRILGVGQREVFGLRKSGEKFPLDLGVSEMRLAGRRQFVGVLRDTSERAVVEQQLRENAARLQAYHDAQEAESALAQKIVNRQMQREGLNDPDVRYWLSPAANFSGDIVAATRGPAQELYIVLADATGHGLGAAICTLPVLSVFYSMGETGVDLRWIIHEINHQLCATLPVGHFVAATLIRIAADGSNAEIWIGGMPDLLLIGQDGAIRQRRSSTNLPLGVDDSPAAAIQTETLPLFPGDQFVIFSDGLLEATGSSGQAFGYSSLTHALAAAPIPDRKDAVRQALLEHLNGGTPHDDVSLMLIGGASA